ISKMVAQGFTVDLDKPLAFQVGHLGEAYDEWVHQPIVTKEGPRFFHSDFWEHGLFIPRNCLIGCLGNIYLDFYRILSSPFPFPHEDQELLGKHGTLSYSRIPSQAPNGPPSTRLSSCLNSYYLWNLAKLIATPSTAPALFGGGLLGYVMYDLTHYYLHHANPTIPVTKSLKKSHLNHHFRIQDKGYGVTSSLWDIVFGTLPTTKALKRAQQKY
ncbi:hypothetical protein HID58_061987, partial [Brassica napus]